MPADHQKSRELKYASALSFVIALRMMGLFLLLPVFMVLAVDVPGYTPWLAGVAVGIYGLTQAVLQQPFGWLSDRWGRRPVLLLGLALFAAGGVIAALVDSMPALIAGRALQGCGAIAGVAMALAADVTRPQRRPIIMAIIGTLLTALVVALTGLWKLEPVLAGAALATVVATAAMLVFSVWHLAFRLGVFAPLTTSLRTRLQSWRHVLHIGLPAMVTNAIIPVSSAIVVAMIATHGVAAVAGYGVAMRIEPMFLIPFYALSAVTSPFFGQNFGAGHFDRLLEARRVVTRFCLLFGLLLAAVLIAVARPLTGIYSEEPSI